LRAGGFDLAFALRPIFDLPAAFGLALVAALGLVFGWAFALAFGRAFNFAFAFATGFAAGFGRLPFMHFASADPSSAGERTVVTRAASSAANLSAAVPLPPEMTAPA
jgi:uncharacterized protein (DUF58 family)